MVIVAPGEQLISVFGVEGGMVQVPTRPEAVQAAVARAPLFDAQKLVTFFESAVSQALVVLVPPQAAKIESNAPTKGRMDFPRSARGKAAARL
jgi:hypothetical protein